MKRRRAMRGASPIWPRALTLTWALGLFALGPVLVDAHAQVVSPRHTAELAGDYRVVRWTTADGLPQNSVNDIITLQNGEMWLATFGGLTRFDGSAFKVLDLSADDALPSNRIVGLEAVGPDAFLFLTQSGHLGRVVRGRAEQVIPSPAPPIDFRELAVDGRGGAFARDVSGGLWHTDMTMPWRREPAGHSGAEPLHGIAIDERGNAWGTLDPGGLVAVGGGSKADPLPFAGARALRYRSGGGLWAGLPSGIGRYSNGRLEQLEIHPPLMGRVRLIEPDGDDRLWVATPGQVFRIDRQVDGTWQRIALPLEGPLQVASLRAGARGTLWIGTDGDGLYRVDRLPTKVFGREAGILQIGGLASDGRGGAYVLDGCVGLSHFSPTGEVRTLAFRDRIPDERLDRTLHTGAGAARAIGVCGGSMAPAPNDGVYVRLGRNLLRIQNGTNRLELVSHRLPVDEGMIVPQADGRIWVVSRSGRILLMTPSGDIAHELSLPTVPYSATLGSDGALWVGGDGAVFVIRGETVERFGPEQNVPRGFVRDLRIEPDGTVWMGTYGGGIGRLRDGRGVRLTVAEGLPDNSVSRLLVDRLDRFWILTNRGLAVVGRRELDAVADGHQRTMAAVVLGIERGVAEGNLGNPAGFTDESGRMWFGTIDGVVVVDAAAFPFNAAPLSVRFEEVRADDRPLPLADVIAVPPTTTRVRVAFTAFDPLYADQIRFRFRVEGVDTDWIAVGTARYFDWTPPSPGDYRLLVEARNEDGVWSAAPAVVVLDVLPAWWQTTLFRVAAALTVLSVAFVAARLRFRGVERRHAARLRVLEEQQQTERRLASMRAQLEHVSRIALAGELTASIAHEVGQPIGAIVNNAEAGKRHLSQYLRQPADLEHLFADIVTDAMRASEVIQGVRGFLHPRGPDAAPIDLSTLVRDALPMVRRELENNGVHVDLALVPHLPPVEGLRVQLTQIVVNLVVNACEALAGREGKRRIAIATYERGDRVELTICDNGPGLAPEVAARLFEPFVTTKPEGLGVGLAVCRSIAERHGGRLSADHAPEGGLCVRLTLPAARPPVPPS